MKYPIIIEGEADDVQNTFSEYTALGYLENQSSSQQGPTVCNKPHTGLANDLILTDIDPNEEEADDTRLTGKEEGEATVAGDHFSHQGGDDGIETLLFSDDDNDDEECEANDRTCVDGTCCDGAGDNCDVGESNGPFDRLQMVAALAEFQKFSPRYKDINSEELLQAMLPPSTVPTDASNDKLDSASTLEKETAGSGGGLTRWYDDVQEFTECL